MLTALILGGLAVFAISVIVHYVRLHWKQIINWFQHWISGHQEVDKDAIGFTIREAIENGEYNIVQGVFNKATSQVEDARRIKAGQVDRQTREQCLGKERVTIFE